MAPVRVLARASLTLAAIMAIAGCGPSASTPRPPQTAVTSPSAAVASGARPVDAISIKSFKFTPQRLSVPVGTAVTWTNDEDSLHTVTSGTPASPSGLFDSGEIDTGVEFPYTFTDEGTYPFFCARHDFMTGVVTVTP